MQRENLEPEAAMVLCIFAEPDLTALAVPPLLYLPVKSKGALAEMEAVKGHADKLPVGFLVFVWDTNDPKKPVYGHARPLIVEDRRGILLNELALHSYTRKIENRMAPHAEN